MSFVSTKKKISHAALMGAIFSAGFGCTQASHQQFGQQREEVEAPAAFEDLKVVETTSSVKVDMLWVIDNSASMLTSQTKLQNGLASFAKKYLNRPGTDIQLAVITTDAFVASPDWKTYLNTPNAVTKKTPLQVHKQKEPNARQWGDDYAKLTSAALMSTKKPGLVSNFQSRVLVGTQGIYEEHGLDSVSQFLTDNEKNAASPNKLFRKGSQRVIIFLSDENDQSMGKHVGPEPRKLLYSGSYYTGSDAAKANAELPAHFTISCPGTPNVAGAPITADTAMTICMRPGTAEPVTTFKAELDQFFRDLDGNPNGNPNYFVAAIVGKEPATIEGLRRNTKEKNSETGLTVITNELGTRYLEFVDVVGNGSFAMDIGATNYAPVLDKIGLEIVNRSVVKQTKPQTSFLLKRVPDVRETLTVTLIKVSGQRIVINANQYTITANKLVITDESLKSALQPGDRITVEYQPATQLPASK